MGTESTQSDFPMTCWAAIRLGLLAEFDLMVWGYVIWECMR
jgi:hypothetical protein